MLRGFIGEYEVILVSVTEMMLGMVVYSVQEQSSSHLPLPYNQFETFILLRFYELKIFSLFFPNRIFVVLAIISVSYIHILCDCP